MIFLPVPPRHDFRVARDQLLAFTDTGTHPRQPLTSRWDRDITKQSVQQHLRHELGEGVPAAEAA